MTLPKQYPDSSQIRHKDGTVADALNGGGGSGSYVATVADVAGLTTLSGIVGVLGYAAIGDGGVGSYYWSSSSAATPDDFFVIRPASNPTVGRWIRMNAEFITPQNFGGKGDGSADDTAAITLALTKAGGVEIYFPEGIYLISSQLTMPSKTKLRGAGKSNSVITLSSSFPLGTIALKNAINSGIVDVYYDEDIKINSLGFTASVSQIRSASYISLSKLISSDITDCAFSNHTYICVEIIASKAVSVKDCLFTNNGRAKPSTVSTPCIWTDTVVGVGTPQGIIIEDNTFLDNNWSCAYLMPAGGSFSFNYCRNNGESGVFTNINGRELRYVGNHIEGQVRSNISASGIETEASSVVIADNIIIGNGSDGISITHSNNIVVHDNIILNNGSEPATFTTAAGIAIITLAGGTTPDHINIHDNRIGDRKATKTQKYGVSVTGGGAAVLRTRIADNDFTEQATGTAVFIATGKFGQGSTQDNNYLTDGTLESPYKLISIQAPASTGDQIIITGHYPRFVEITATLSFDAILQSVGMYDGSQQICHSITAGDTAGTGGPNSGIISIMSELNAVQCAATLINPNDQGFTLNYTAVTTRPWLLIRSYK